MNNLIESLLSTSVSEDTTSAAIAYLPSGFVPVAKALSPLKKKKKKWKMKVKKNYETNMFEFKFEDVLSIGVKGDHLEAFQEDMCHIGSMSEEGFIFGDPIKEDKSIDQALKLLEGALYGLLTEDMIDRLSRHVDRWSKLFGVRKLKDNGKISLKLETYREDIVKFIDTVKKTYGEDIGAIEMLVTKIENKEALGAEEVFKGKTFLLGSVIVSNYKGVRMQFEGTLDLNFVPQESIWLDSDEVADEMSARKDVKGAKGMLYPVGKVFKTSVFKDLKDEIKLEGTNKDKE